MKLWFSKLGAESQGVVLALFGMLAFSLFDASIKHTMREIEFAQVIFVTYVFNILMTGGTGLVQKKSFLPKRWRHIFIVVTLNVLEQLCFLNGLKYLPFAELFVVILATPMMVLVFSSLFLKEHIHRHQAIAMVAGFMGALLVALTPLLSRAPLPAGTVTPAGGFASIGWACAVANVFFGAARICYIRKYAQDENLFSLTLMLFVVLLLIAAINLPPDPFNFGVGALLPLAAGCAIGNIGLFAYLKAFGKISAPLIASTQYSQIIWALPIGYFWFSETPSLAGIAGSVLILFSGYFLYLRKYKLEN